MNFEKSFLCPNLKEPIKDESVIRRPQNESYLEQKPCLTGEKDSLPFPSIPTLSMLERTSWAFSSTCIVKKEEGTKH